MRRSFRMLCLLGAVGFAACADSVETPTETAPLGVSAQKTAVESNAGVAEAAEAAVRAAAVEVERKFGVEGAALYSASWLGDGDQQDMGGNLVFFNDRGNKQIPIQWVPGDPRRGGRTNIKYANDLFFFGAPFGPPLDPNQVDAALDAAMGTWDALTCSRGLDIQKTTLFDPDFDIVHAGFFPFLAPTTLAATFLFIWVDPNGPTDIDGDGNLDYAFAVIFYNPIFPWDFGSGGVDVQTVALHEAGHGLGQAHFGKAFLNRGGLHFAPRAVMNATYSGVQRTIGATDNAGHCSMFGSWPNN